MTGPPFLISRCLPPLVLTETREVELDTSLVESFDGMLRAAGASPSTLTLQALCSSSSPCPNPKP